jgi:hypothetical protein
VEEILTAKTQPEKNAWIVAYKKMEQILRTETIGAAVEFQALVAVPQNLR